METHTKSGSVRDKDTVCKDIQSWEEGPRAIVRCEGPRAIVRCEAASAVNCGSAREQKSQSRKQFEVIDILRTVRNRHNKSTYQTHSRSWVTEGCAWGTPDTQSCSLPTQLVHFCCWYHWMQTLVAFWPMYPQRHPSTSPVNLTQPMELNGTILLIYQLISYSLPVTSRSSPFPVWYQLNANGGEGGSCIDIVWTTMFSSPNTDKDITRINTRNEVRWIHQPPTETFGPSKSFFESRFVCEVPIYLFSLF